MDTVRYSVDMKEESSRLELLVRFVYWIPLAVVMWVLSIICGICTFVQWFHILFLKKRHSTLHKYIRMYVDYQVKVSSYTVLLTDERPEIIPEGA